MSKHADKEPAHVEFFARDGSRFVRLYSHGVGCDPYVGSGVYVENLYQHFKARMMAELGVDARRLGALGELVNKRDEA